MMIKANDVVFWKGPNGLHRRWADVVDTNGDQVRIKLRHDIFDYDPYKGKLHLREGEILSVPINEVIYNSEYYRSREKIKEHMDSVRKDNKKPIAAGEIW